MPPHPLRWLACLPLLVLPAAAQPLPTFPGADGAGSVATGGRGGLVYHVTKVDQNFSDSGPGTLRYGLSDGNFGGAARTIVFDVAGTFWLGRYGAERGHDNGWDTQSRLNLGSNVTIAGQTAPGPVMIMGGVIKANGQNTVLRNVTIAPGYGMRNFAKPEDGVEPTPGDFPDAYVYDALDISGQQVMIDHVTTLYATDETVSVNELADELTVQYSSISQGQNYPQADAEGGGSFTGHGLGSLIQPGSGANVSFHHNLYAHQKGRLPRVGTETGDLTDPSVGGYNDFRNNVFYNWFGTAGQGAGGQPSQNNFIGNFYLAGPGGDDPIGGSNPGITQRSGGTGVFSGSSSTKVFFDDNLKDTNKDGDANDTSTATFSGSIQRGAFTQTPYHGVTDSAADAYNRVLDYAGATWWDRTFVDQRLFDETRTGAGKILAWADDPFNDDPNEGVEWREMLALRADPSTGAAPFQHSPGWDDDQDGMPNFWEEVHGLPTGVANNNADFDADGYTDLEEYLNDVAAWPAPAPLVFTGASSNRYALTQNWDIPWQPSRFDQVRVESGAALVDAVGQHAGGVFVGDQAELRVEGGWLMVEATGFSAGLIELGASPTDAASLSVSGGELYAHRIDKTTGGILQLTGGKLHADEVGFGFTVEGGAVAPGWSIGQTTVEGDLTFASGSLEVELDGESADLLSVLGDLNLGGGASLDVVALGGSSADPLLIAEYTGALSGAFAAVTDGYLVSYATPGQILLLVGDGPALPGDFNGDGLVDAADYTLWRDNLGGAFDLAGNGDESGASQGLVDQQDYLLWRANFGASSAAPGAAPAPEPAAMVLLLAASGLLGAGRRRG